MNCNRQANFRAFCLLKYLEQENASDLIKFWLQADNFTHNILNLKEDYKLNRFDDHNEALFKQIQNDAMVIYEK